MPGRFERVDEGQPFVVVVDYAHTDDALRNVISVARGLESEARHHAVRLRRRPRPHQAAADGAGGGGGERLRGADQRQSALGGSAGDHERCAGRASAARTCRTWWNRIGTTAIARALKEARDGDIVILAGKGHETYQVLKDKTIAFRRSGCGERSAAGVTGITKPSEP